MTHTAIARPVVVTAGPRRAPPARASRALDRSADRLAWLWLAIGLALLPFSTVHAELPLAAWLAPIFVMRFARTQPVRLGILLVVIVSGAAMAFAWRDMFSFPIGSIIGLTYGLAFSLAYALDRLLSPRLRGVARTLVFPLAVTAIDWLMSADEMPTIGTDRRRNIPSALSTSARATSWGVVTRSAPLIGTACASVS